MNDLDQMQDYEDQVFEAAENTGSTADHNYNLPKENKMSEERNYTVETKTWAGKLNELETTNGIYVFPLKGSTKVRILLSPECAPENFYTPVLRMYKGQGSTKFMLPVIVLDENNTWSEDVKYLVLPKTALQGILTILAGGEYDLLHPVNGHGITIVRTGEMLLTKYNVLPSKSPVPVKYDFYEFAKPLMEYAKDLEASDREDNEVASPAYDDDDIPF